MAFPPPFPNPMMQPPRVPQGGPFQKFGFFSPQTNAPPPMQMQMPTLPMVGGIPLVLRPHRPFMRKKPDPPPFVQPKTIPLCTIFIGSITDKCHDSVIQDILGSCGTVNNWKRLQDSNGKFKPFGFCDFLYPDGAGRALRILKGYPLGDKRLNVTTDEQTEKIIQEFLAKVKDEMKIGATNGGANIAEETEQKKDEAAKEVIKKIIEEQAPELLELTPADEEPSSVADDGDKAKNEVGKSPATDGTKTPTAKRNHSRSSSVTSSQRRKRNRKPATKRSRRSPSSSSSTSSGDSSTTASSAHSGRSSRRDKHRNKKTIRKRTPSSEDSDEVAEKRREKRELKEREESYLKRLKKWEDREKRMAKQYAKDEETERQRVKTIQKEAKKLRQFLEDYIDHRDDPKYYKSTALFERRRNYEREREADAKDRREERKELEEVKKIIMKEEKRGPSRQEDEGNVITWDTVADEQKKKGTDTAMTLTPIDAGTPQPVTAPSISAEIANQSPSPAKQAQKIVTTLQQKTLSAPVNGLFGEDDDEEDTLHQIKKKIKPFEITREDRIHSLTPEERKKLIKELIGRIPTEREKLFEFTISWEFLDEQLMDGRVRPWINKKISDYIGEEEPSLVTFICEKIEAQSSPNDILQDLSMVLDDEAEVFMVKLWRLIVYESEAKRLGLNVLPSGKSTS